MQFFLFWLTNFLKNAEAWVPDGLDQLMAGPDIMIDG